MALYFTIPTVLVFGQLSLVLRISAEEIKVRHEGLGRKEISEELQLENSRNRPSKAMRGQQTVSAVSKRAAKTRVKPARSSIPKILEETKCKQTLTARNGSVQWKGDNKAAVCAWLIKRGRDEGIALQFSDLSLSSGDSRRTRDSLMVYRKAKGEKWKQLRRTTGILFPRPVIDKKSNVILVLVETHRRSNNTCNGKSSFTFKYGKYPARRLPLPIDGHAYHCFAQHIIPEELKCDILEQCIKGQDEKDCSHRHPHCEKGWFFANWTTWSACMTVSVADVPVNLEEAIGFCEDLLGSRAGLGFFPTPDSQALAVSLISRAGYKQAWVDLRLENPKDENRNQLYRFTHQWLELYREYNKVPKFGLDREKRGTLLRISPVPHYVPVDHSHRLRSPVICMSDYRSYDIDLTFSITKPSRQPDKFPVKQCSDGTYVQTFHHCELNIEHATWSQRNLPLLHCDNGLQVHYSLACDGFDDCADATDESNCEKAYFGEVFLDECRSGQRIKKGLDCNGVTDCLDGSDEEACDGKCKCGLTFCNGVPGCLPNNYMGICNTTETSDCVESNQTTYYRPPSSPPAREHLSKCAADKGQSSLKILELDGFGLSFVREAGEGESCPETHYRCKANLCIPSYLVNNGQYDCPWPFLDDEHVHGVSWSEYYRCYRKDIHIHPHYLCDGVYHCPLKDDERYCDIKCPENCECEGFVYICDDYIDFERHPFARYIDLSGHIFSPIACECNMWQGLIRFVNLSGCNQSETEFDSSFQLRVLDLSHNIVEYKSFLAWKELSQLNYLNLSHNPLGYQLEEQFTQLTHVARMTKLTWLSLKHTGLEIISPRSFRSLRVLRYLDISENNITFIPSKTFATTWALEVLNIRGNKISVIDGNIPYRIVYLDLSQNEITFLSTDAFVNLVQMKHLNLSRNYVRHISGNFPAQLRYLDVRENQIESISDNVFLACERLQYLNVRHNKIERISKDIFRGPAELDTLLADDYDLCCAYFGLYQETSGGTQCDAPRDDLSSCSDLLQSPVYRVWIWIFSLLALLGNSGVLMYRLFLEAEGSSLGFRVLVCNLCGSDFLMGVYLMMVGSADAVYRGEYVWRRRVWTQSLLCQTAGFLALLSCEVSTFIICIITLDRLLVFRFPLKRHLHFTWRSTAVASGGSWLVGILLAATPLVPGTGWEFYSQTGICLPLPITRPHFPGKQFAFGIFIVLNFVLFLLIGFGQILIYRAVLATSMADTTGRHQRDIAIARRLALIVVSDFCCWFPVGVMGLMASRGVRIPSEFNIYSAIFVLPLNSAVNPFLYTLNTLLERRRQRNREARVKRTMGRLRSEIRTWPEERLEELAEQLKNIRERRKQTARSSSTTGCEHPRTEGEDNNERDTSAEEEARASRETIPGKTTNIRKDKTAGNRLRAGKENSTRNETRAREETRPKQATANADVSIGDNTKPWKETGVRNKSKSGRKTSNGEESIAGAHSRRGEETTGGENNSAR